MLLLIDIELSYMNTNHEDFIGFAKWVRGFFVHFFSSELQAAFVIGFPPLKRFFMTRFLLAQRPAEDQPNEQEEGRRQPGTQPRTFQWEAQCATSDVFPSDRHISCFPECFHPASSQLSVWLSLNTGQSYIINSVTHPALRLRAVLHILHKRFWCVLHTNGQQLWDVNGKLSYRGVSPWHQWGQRSAVKYHKSTDSAQSGNWNSLPGSPCARKDAECASFFFQCSQQWMITVLIALRQLLHFS